ncbi:MAG TPA: 16S rRNA (adenine(1518)-N(6)/adenine(1519)-N(6))-dimethyltransferase, partial [Brevundimonas sp.]|nr:16S rRNA (adenine(1518)-N(6)/adenine(1519)-N(6))-dimethyltransferase [Brevundimonas sp.]
MTDLPSLRESLDAHGLMAKKSFGQHFLLDLNVTRKIARLAGPFAGDAVIEVGPGPGGLTRALMESDAGRVVAVEKDARFLPLLGELDDGSGRLHLVEGDALKVDERSLVDGPAHLVSNLPYNVGTALLIKWLTGPWTPASMTLMFQKEVAQRVVAQPDDDAYGRLAVISQALCEAR